MDKILPAYMAEMEVYDVQRPWEELMAEIDRHWTTVGAAWAISRTFDFTFLEALRVVKEAKAEDE